MTLRLRALVVPLLVAPVLAAGCISVAVGGKDDAVAAEDRFHVVEVPPSPPSPPASRPPSAERRPAGTTIVTVRPFRAADRFDRHVVRRDGPGRITPLEGDYWADEPSHAVTDVVRETLAASARFRAVVEPANAVAADVIVDGQIQEYAIVAGAPSQAVVRIRFTVSEARSGRVLSTSLHEASENLAGEGTDGLGVAMGRAIARAARAAIESQVAAEGAPPRE